MRILVGMPYEGSHGGPATCEPPFIMALREGGVDIVEEVYVYGESPGGTTTFERITRVLRTACKFRRRVRHDRFDLIHLNTAFDLKAVLRDAVVLLALPRRRGKLFLKLHGSDAAHLRADNFVWRKLNRFVLARADAVGVLSSEERSNFILSGVAAEKLFVVENAVGSVSDEGDELFASTLGAARDVPVLLFIARFVETKGLVDVVRACGILRDEGRRFVLVCVGDGAARGEAEAEVRSLGLGDAVRFTGHIPERQTGAFYRRSTMLVFPTHHDEGFPMTVFRALAAGLPIITTRIRAAADHLREPENCLWVEPRHPAQLAACVGYLLDHPDVRERMKRCNTEAARRFTPEHVAERYVEVYREVIARG